MEAQKDLRALAVEYIEAVGDKKFIGLRIDLHIRRPMKIHSVGIALALIAVADLHDELAIPGEL